MEGNILSGHGSFCRRMAAQEVAVASLAVSIVSFGGGSMPIDGRRASSFSFWFVRPIALVSSSC